MPPKKQPNMMDIVDLSPTDPWADVQAATERRLALEIEAKAKAEARRMELRHERWNSIWTGVGVIIGIVVAAAVILGVAFMTWRTAENNRVKDIEINQQRTQQIEACTKLEQPLERQYCLLTVNTPSSEKEN